MLYTFDLNTFSGERAVLIRSLDDPTLQPIFHPLHGLITLHSFPHTQLLPPTIKHSSLLGLSAGGGGSENNLGFRARRKRWGVETVHLGVEGGVGERRTEPAPEVARMVSTSTSTASNTGSTVVSTPSPTEGVERSGGTGVNASAEEAGSPVGGGEVKPAKKEKRARVRFGEDEVMTETASAGGHHHAQSERAHGDHGHDHGHGQSHTPRVIVRHDRPDLYEF